MLRSNHLQPGINLNPISFPSADLTLKVFEYIYVTTYLKIRNNPIYGSMRLK